MMVRNHLVVISLLMLWFAVGCQKKSLHEKFRTFENDVWERFDYVRFDFDIDRLNVVYDAWLVLHYTDEFQGRLLPLHVELVTPEGDSRTKDVNVFIRSVYDGSELGIRKNSYYEVRTLTHRSLQFTQKGTCTFEIENLNSKYFTHGIRSVGYVLEPSRQKD